MSDPIPLLSERDIRAEVEQAEDAFHAGKMTKEQYVRRLRFLAAARALIVTKTDEAQGAVQ